MTRVFPVPAPANTSKGPLSVVTAVLWARFNPSSEVRGISPHLAYRTAGVARKPHSELVLISRAGRGRPAKFSGISGFSGREPVSSQSWHCGVERQERFEREKHSAQEPRRR